MLAALTVLYSNIARVIGPTPPAVVGPAQLWQQTPAIDARW